MPSLTRTLKQLEELFLITRQVDKHDKRSKKIYFTEQGRNILKAVEAQITDIKNQLYNGLSDEQLDVMAHGLIKMEDNAKNYIKYHSSNKVNNDT